MSTREDILKIHSTPHKIVLAITGGGAEAIGELLRFGQGSNTLIEAVVPYDQKSFDNFIKGTPDKYCSPSAARDLAMAAYQRAIKFTGIENATTLMGIGVSCSLAKDNERVGRKHHVYIAVQEQYRTTTYELDNLSDNISLSFCGNKLRELQEKFVSETIINILAYHFRATYDTLRDKPIIGPYGVSWYNGTPDQFKLLTGQIKSLIVLEKHKPENPIIFAGSFNPFHEQHRNIVEKVYEMKKTPIDLEICIHNVDKPSLNYYSLNERESALKELENQPWLGNIYFTALPTFAEKACHFPGTTFIVGWDTFKRIGDPKYGDVKKALNIFNNLGTKFIATHRIIDGKSSVNETLEEVYQPLLDITQIISPEILPPVAISSSEIRKNNT